VAVSPSVFLTPIAPKCGPVKAAKPVYHACCEREIESASIGPSLFDMRFSKSKSVCYTKVVQDTVCINSPVPPAPLSCCGTGNDAGASRALKYLEGRPNGSGESCLNHLLCQSSGM
jgi:hypothetical protein